MFKAAIPALSLCLLTACGPNPSAEADLKRIREIQEKQEADRLADQKQHEEVMKRMVEASKTPLK